VSLVTSEAVSTVDAVINNSVAIEVCETVVFGKGIGESILVRLSSQEWLIVDSCLNNNKRPAALDYLIDHGVDVSQDVKLIIISHFHDDHISGLSDIIEICTSATLVISAALNSDDFKEYIEALSKTGAEMARTKEIKKIMAFLPNLKADSRLKYAKRDCILFRSKTGVEVHSLSPSDYDIAQSDIDFSNSLKVARNMPDVASSAKIVNPNHYCVVSRVYSPTSEDNEILLGADLEIKKNTGWDAVCEALNSPRPRKTGIFKLPHHGSKTGFHKKTWDELVKEKPISIMTTFDKSSLPRADMISVYKEMSSSLYCTSEPKPYSRQKKEEKENGSTSTNKAKKILEKMGSSVSFSNLKPRFGYVKVVNCLTSSPSVSVHEAAVNL